MDKNKNIYDTVRFIVNLLYRMVGVWVLSFLFLVVFRNGMIDLGIVVFFVWLGLYLLFVRAAVYDIKSRSERWTKSKTHFCLAIIRGPMTALNIIIIYAFFNGLVIPLPLWLCLLAAWSVIPVNMLIDYMEKKQCS